MQLQSWAFLASQRSAARRSPGKFTWLISSKTFLLFLLFWAWPEQRERQRPRRRMDSPVYTASYVLPCYALRYWQNVLEDRNRICLEHPKIKAMVTHGVRCAKDIQGCGMRIRAQIAYLVCNVKIRVQKFQTNMQVRNDSAAIFAGKYAETCKMQNRRKTAYPLAIPNCILVCSCKWKLICRRKNWLPLTVKKPQFVARVSGQALSNVTLQCMLTH